MARSSRRAIRALSHATLTCAAALTATAGLASSAHADHVKYEIDRLGFIDTEHTSFAGTRFSFVVDMSPKGRVIGNQTRYEGQVDPTGLSAWYFGDEGLTRVGLFDAAHTSSAGEQNSSALFVNDLGYAAGTSTRYLPSGPAGQSGWVYFNGQSPDKNVRVGFFNDSLHTRTGVEQTTVTGLNAVGDAIGNSDTYVGTTAISVGSTAFIHNHGATTSTQIGLTGGIYTRNDSLEFSEAQLVNDAGAVGGISRRYSGASQIGQTAWVRSADGLTTTPVGFADSEHTNGANAATSAQSSTIVALNNSGTAVGHSIRYPNGGGQTAWIQTGSTPTKLGFYDSAYTRGNGSNGEKLSKVEQFNNGGFATGFSTRYNGADTAGQSAWVYSSSLGNQQVGLFDDEHTGTNNLGVTNYQSSTALFLSSTGKVAGTSERFSATNAPAGKSAWLYFSGAASQHIGFFDAQHTRDDGFRDSTPVAINDAGQVVGESTRYKTGQAANWGTTAWLQMPGAGTPPAIRIGLTDFNHTRSPGTDDYQESHVQFLNSVGQAAGFSARFNGNATSFGQSGWFYDDGLNQTFEITGSTRSDGFTNTVVTYLSDSGVAIGYYTLYSGAATVGDRAFLWDFNTANDPGTPLDDRFYDLGALVEGGLGANGWAALNRAIEMSTLGHIRGQGTITDGTNLPYLLTPVPEPTGVALLAVTAIAVLPRRRRLN
jgi:hypothetical protein